MITCIPKIKDPGIQKLLIQKHSQKIFKLKCDVPVVALMFLKAK